MQDGNDFIASFNPAMYEVQDFYEDIKKIKALCVMLEKGDYSEIDTLLAVLKNARRHFWFKLVESNQEKLLNSEKEVRELITLSQRMPNNQILRKNLGEKIEAHIDMFSRFKSAVGLAVKFDQKPMTTEEMFRRGLGIDNKLTLIKVAKLLEESLVHEWDNVIAITGDEGTGKSMLAMQLAHHINNEFTMKDNVAFVPDEKQIYNMVTGLPPFSAIVLDEAIKAFYKLNWNNRMQIMLNELFTMCRNEHKATILCIPSILDLNKFMRSRRVRVWIHVMNRGFACVFMKDKSPFTEDPFHIDDTIRLIKKKNMNFTKLRFHKQVDFLRSLPNFADFITFPKLTRRSEKEYKDLKNANRYEDFEAKINKKDSVNREKKAMLKMVLAYRKEKKSWAEIAHITGYNESTIQKWLKQYKLNLTGVKREDEKV